MFPIVDNEKNQHNLARLFLTVLLILMGYAVNAEDSPVIIDHNFNLLDRLNISYELDFHTSELMGDRYDNSTGTVIFSHTDVSIPGNFDIDVAIGRSYNTNETAIRGQPFDDWVLEIPRITYPVLTNLGTSLWPYAFQNQKHCSYKSANHDLYPRSSFAAPHAMQYTYSYGYSIGEVALFQEVFNNVGFKLIVPGRTQERFLFDNGNLQGVGSDHRFVTANKWKIGCVAQPDGTGEGFQAVSPDGVTYTFDIEHLSSSVNSVDLEIAELKFSNLTFYPSKVEDRFGNWVRYHYTNGRLDRITSSDNRTITITYNGNESRIRKITANGREWVYNYGQFGRLNKVTRPDGKFWTLLMRNAEYYKLEEERTPRFCDRKDTYQSGALPPSHAIKITHPDGAIGKFWLGFTLQGRSNVNAVPESRQPTNARCSNPYSLLKKTVSTLGGQGEYTWLYDYSQNPGHYLLYPNSPWEGADLTSLKLAGTLPSNVDALHSKWVKVTQPDGSYVKIYVNRDASDYFEGKVLAEEYYSATGVKHREAQYTYQQGTLFGDAVIGSDDLEQFEQNVKLTKRATTSFDGGSSTSYTTEYSSFDSYDVPQVRYEYNSYSNNKRYAKYTYDNDTTNWLLSLPRTVALSTDGTAYTTVKETTYHTANGNYKSAPNCISWFGRSFKCHKTYHSDGNIKRTEFALTNRWVEYTNYKRGTAQTTKVPGRYDGSTTVSRTLVVDDNGWTKKVTDLNGNVTDYSYNLIGRLTLIDPADTAWANTVITYQDVTSGDLSITGAGLVAGQLKQTITQGNYEKTLFLDSWLRPVLTRERDTGDSINTTRYVRVDYNADNQPTFQSYASTSAGESDGISTSYDGLQRVKSITNTAINKSTTHEYLAGNKIRITDFKGNATTTTHLAYGAPQREAATRIASPENITTDINYNIYGNIDSVAQGGFTSSYVYDAYQRLCKFSRPETGWTYRDYNSVNEPIWEAQGITSTVATCDHETIAAHQKVTYQYDNHGQRWKTLYADSTPDKVATRDNNGNLLTLTAGGANWTYTYNSLDLVETETLAINGKTFLLDPTYDNLGNRISLKYPSGRVLDFTTNGLGQAETVGAYVTDAEYHPGGTLKTTTYGNGLTYSINLNSRKLPQDMYVKTSDGTDLSDLSYSYDDNANVVRILDRLDANYTIDMSYDKVDRIKTAEGYWGAGSFTYDTLGNVKTKVLGSQSLTYHYDTQNRLNSVTGSKGYLFSYDARGNVVENGYRPFTYNLANQLTDSNGISYQYDGHNRRVIKTVNGKTTYSVYSLDGQLFYRQKDNGDHIDYLYLDKHLVTTVESR